jgi:DNA repair protein RadA/Sms
VFAGMEGTRPVLVEIQALVAPTRARHAAARRGRLGPERLAMVLAVLEARIAGCASATNDVYLNVAGGLKHRRARRRPRGRRGARLVAAQCAAAAGTSISARSALSGVDPAGGARRRAAQGGAEARFARAVLPRPALGGDRPAPGLSGIDQLGD